MNQNKLRVVQINATYGKGSTGRIVKDIHEYLLENNFDSFVFAPVLNISEINSDYRIQKIGGKFDHNIHAILWRVFQNQGWNSFFATKRLCRRIKSLSPDIVHLHNLHSNYINMSVLLRFLSKEKIPTILTMHDCWFFTGSCFHFLEYSNCQKWRVSCEDCPKYKSFVYKKITLINFNKKRELFANNQKLGVIGVSQWITECSANSKILKNAKMFYSIYNWIDCNVFLPYDSKKIVRNRYGIAADKKIILGVAQGWSVLKGINEFILLAERLHNNAVVLLVGDRNGEKDSENLKILGYTENQIELAQLYAAADVFVNPSRMETFGKVTAEALACGTPVACYSNTGTKELIKPEVGECVEDGNADVLICAIEKILANGKEKYSAACRNRALQLFNKNAQISKYIEIYQNIIGIENNG